ncbi:hypothetical protein Tco_1488277, partial [Tanacetum coccineum]
MVEEQAIVEFWSIVVAYDPSPLIDESEQRPLREFLIKFLVLNGKRPLTLDFNTFYSSTGLDYKNSKYVAPPTPEVVKKELMNSKQQLLAYSLITGNKVDIGEIIYSDLVTKLLNKSRQIYVSYPRFISCALQVLLGYDYTQDVKFRFLPDILSNSNFTKDPSKVHNIELTAHMIVVNNQKDLVSPLPFSGKKKKVKSQTVTPTLPKYRALRLQISSGTVPDPQDPERNIQLADSRGNDQPADKGLPSMASNEGTTKTTSCLEGPLGDKDLEGKKLPADMKPIYLIIVDPLGTDVEYQVDETQSTRLSDEEEVFAAGDDMEEETQD